MAEISPSPVSPVLFTPDFFAKSMSAAATTTVTQPASEDRSSRTRTANKSNSQPSGQPKTVHQRPTPTSKKNKNKKKPSTLVAPPPCPLNNGGGAKNAPSSVKTVAPLEQLLQQAAIAANIDSDGEPDRVRSSERSSSASKKKRKGGNKKPQEPNSTKSKPLPTPVAIQLNPKREQSGSGKNGQKSTAGKDKKKGKPRKGDSPLQTQQGSPQLNWQQQLLQQDDRRNDSGMNWQQQLLQQEEQCQIHSGRNWQQAELFKRTPKGEGKASGRQPKVHPKQRLVKAHPGHTHTDGHLHPSGPKAEHYAADTYSSAPAPSVLPVPDELLSPTHDRRASENLLGVLTRAMAPATLSVPVVAE